MNGPDHYRKAEQLLAGVMGPVGDETPTDDSTGLVANTLAAAQVHATLAQAAAIAYQAVHDYYGDDSDDGRSWAEVTG